MLKPRLGIGGKQIGIEEMKNDLSTVDWESVFLEKDAQHCWDFFHETVDKIVEEHVPLRAVKNSSKPIWMNTNILRIVRKKRKLWKKYVKTRDYEQFVAYKKIEKDVKNCIRKAKKNIESKLAKDMKKNPKAFYSYINSKKSSRDTIGPLKIDERLIENDCDIAEHLNSFFSSVFTHDDPNCNFNVPRIKENIVNLENFDVLTDNVRKKLNNLKPFSAPGPDGLRPSLLKDLSTDLCLPLAIMFQKSIDEQSVPKEWKNEILLQCLKKIRNL